MENEFDFKIQTKNFNFENCFYLGKKDYIFENKK